MVARHVLRFSWLLFAVTVVALAVLLSAARLLLPGMSEYKTDIASAAEKFIHHPVEIGALDAAWRGLSPVLRLQEVVIRDAPLPGNALRVEEVQIGLDIVQSLIQGDWRMAGIKAIGFDLQIETALSAAEGEAQGLEPLAWLLQQHSIALERVNIVWTDAGLFEQPLQLSDLSAQLINEGRRHQFLLNTGLSAFFGKRLKMAADLNGDVADFGGWEGSLYLDTRGLRTDVARQWLAGLGLAAGGQVDLELWAGLRGDRLEWGTGSVAMHDPQIFNSSRNGQGFQADLLSSVFHWESFEEGVRLGLTEFQVQRDNEAIWPSTTLGLAIETGEAMRVRGSASRIVVDEVISVLPLLPWVDRDAILMVERMRPDGELHDAEFEAEFIAGMAPKFSLRASFEDLEVSASGGLPGVSGLSGSIEGNLQSGYLRLDSSKASVSLPKVFSESPDLSHLAGVVHWQRYANSFRVESRQLRVASDQLDILARLQLDWPYEQASPWLDLQLALSDVPLEVVNKYLPDKVIKPKAVAWLNDAFGAGTASNGRFLLQGRLDQLPFDGGEGRLEARFDFEDVVLDYHPQWGRLTELDGDAAFVGRSMVITGTSARILDSPVERVVATIENFKKPILTIDGTVSGTLPGMLQYINHSPLEKSFGGLVEQVETRGDAHLYLGLSIPLAQELGQVRIDGTVEFEKNFLKPKAGDLVIDEVQGRLLFTKDSISAEKIRARLFGQPVIISVYQQGAGERAKTLVDVAGDLKLVAMMRQRYPAVSPFIDGESSWHAVLHIPSRQRPGHPRVELQLYSDLQGVAIDLPVPFRKAADEVRAIAINWAPGELASQPVMVSYGEAVDARILLNHDVSGIRKAGIRLGNEVAELPLLNEINVTGDVAALDLGEWIPFMKVRQGGADTKVKPPVPPLAFTLSVEEFSLSGYRVNKVNIRNTSADPLYFVVDGEGAAGWLRWTFGDDAMADNLQLQFEHLRLNPVEDRGVLAADRSLPDPLAFPELDVSIAETQLGQRMLGQVAFVTKRVDRGIRMESVSMESKAVVAHGDGFWLQHEDERTSGVSVEISGGELGNLVKLFGDSGSVKGGKLSGTIKLNWAGGPTDFSLATLEGELDLAARDGRLVDVEQGAGKLLSLFSLNSLQRRLSLDFSDVTKEGFSFDKMDGRFVVMDGSAFTTDFTIRGGSAVIEIAGRTGLIERDYDQLVTVTPQISSSLPLAGAIAGGPAVGAAVLLAEKLVGDEFNKMTQIQYRVTGTWDAPVYEKLRKERKDAPAGVGKEP